LRDRIRRRLKRRERLIYAFDASRLRPLNEGEPDCCDGDDDESDEDPMISANTRARLGCSFAASGQRCRSRRLSLRVRCTYQAVPHPRDRDGDRRGAARAGFKRRIHRRAGRGSRLPWAGGLRSGSGASILAGAACLACRVVRGYSLRSAAARGISPNARHRRGESRAASQPARRWAL
jgi:hypothetical protein